MLELRDRLSGLRLSWVVRRERPRMKRASLVLLPQQQQRQRQRWLVRAHRTASRWKPQLVVKQRSAPYFFSCCKKTQTVFKLCNSFSVKLFWVGFCDKMVPRLCDWNKWMHNWKPVPQGIQINHSDQSFYRIKLIVICAHWLILSFDLTRNDDEQQQQQQT